MEFEIQPATSSFRAHVRSTIFKLCASAFERAITVQFYSQNILGVYFDEIKDRSELNKVLCVKMPAIGGLGKPDLQFLTITSL